MRRWRSIASLTLALAAMLALLSGTGTAQAASCDYIVMLKPGVSVQGHLKAMKVTPNRLYGSAAAGYQATLNDTQYKRVLASVDTTIVTPDALIAQVPAIQAPPQVPIQPPQDVDIGVKRIDGMSSPSAAIDGIVTREVQGLPAPPASPRQEEVSE